jgi:hypothetical protein
VERISLGPLLADGARLAARSGAALLVAAVGFGAVAAAVALGGGRWMPLVLLVDLPVAALVTGGGWRGLRRLPQVLAIMTLVYLVAGALGLAVLLPTGGHLRSSAGIALLLMWCAIEIVLYSRWFVVVPVAMHEGVRGALARSGQLTAPVRRALGALLVVVLAFFVGGSLVTEVVVGGGDARWFWTAPACAVWAAFSLLRAGLAAVAYRELRAEPEPLHLEQVFD